MTKNKSLRRALVMSIISILVCSAMLVGATFAWFSDSVSTGVNKIIAGNLKVDIQDLNGKSLDGESGEATLFNTEGVLWEPGMMFVSAPFVVVNKGNLALQYTIDTLMDDVSETLVGNRLSEVIKFKVANYADVEIEDSVAGRADFWAGIEAGAMGGVLEAEGKSEALVVVLYWEPTANDNDNLYNVTADQIKPVSDEDTEEYSALETHFAIQVTAQQVSSESDSFGPGYDANSAFGKVHSTIVNGVDLLNNETDMGLYARLGELTKVGANHYVSHVTLDAFGTKYDEELGDTRAVTIGDVYYDIAETLFGEVISQSAEIYSIKVTINDLVSEYEDQNPLVSNGGELTQEQIVWGPCAAAMIDFLVSIGQPVNSSTLKYLLEEAPVSLMAGNKINVTMTTMDGIATTYTLDFSVAFADTESSANIHNALKNGVNGANEAFVDQGIENITVSELQFVGDQYVADVTFAEDCTDVEDVFNGYIAIANFLADLVKGLSANGDVTAVSVGGFDLVESGVTDSLDTVSLIKLSLALAQWGRADILDDDQRAEVDAIEEWDVQLLTLADIMLANLDGHSCEVTFTDAEGNVLVYTLNFSVLGEIQGSLLDAYNQD